MDRRRIFFAAGAAAVLAIALVLLLAGGDEDVTQEPASTVGTSPAGPQSESTAPGSTGKGSSSPESTAPRSQTPPEVLTNGPRRDVARAVSELVQAVELGDGQAFCRLVGRRPGQAKGIEALRACGRQAGIDPFGLPSSDELSVNEVEVRGASAVARLAGGQTATLQRSGGRWLVRSFAAAPR